MPLIIQSRIYRVDLRANPNVLYIFGDNEARVGRGGQAAEMRDEPNAVGVATLQYPGIYWSDDNYDHQTLVISQDLIPVVEALRAGRTVVFPLDGIGTGLANLPTSAPRTFAFLQACIADLKSL